MDDLDVATSTRLGRPGRAGPRCDRPRPRFGRTLEPEVKDSASCAEGAADVRAGLSSGVGRARRGHLRGVERPEPVVRGGRAAAPSNLSASCSNASISSRSSSRVDDMDVMEDLDVATDVATSRTRRREAGVAASPRSQPWQCAEPPSRWGATTSDGRNGRRHYRGPGGVSGGWKYRDRGADGRDGGPGIACEPVAA
jgi:hypothetical protein